MNKTIQSNKPVGFRQKFRNYFRFDSYNAIMKKEIIGGITTFLAMAYILAVNPSLVGSAPIDPKVPPYDLDGVFHPQLAAAQYQGGLFLATALSAFLGTLFMGLWARVPIAVAPGMGLNAFFAFTVASQVGFESALTVTILSGVLYLIVVLTPARQKIAEMIPHNFKIAIGAAIGIFIAYLGLQNSGIIVQDPSHALVSGLGDFANPLVITALCLTILGLILHFGKVPGAIMINMGIGAVIVIILVCSGVIKDPAGQVLDAKSTLLGNYSDFGSFANVAKAG